ncbi:MAG: hypothetical protein J6K51_04265 [Clostridia bacterium]|nr:hypothetical protein [Clostridia bacterium]
MVIDLGKIKLTISQVLDAEKFILLAQTEKTVYDDGKPTDKKQIVATVTTAESLFEKVDVKLDGVALPITDEVLKERIEKFDFVYVSFEADEVRFYRDFTSGQNKVTAKAKSIQLYNDAEIDLD